MRSAVLLLLVACGGSGASDAAPDARGPDAASSQSLRVELLVNVFAQTGQPEEAQPVDLRVTVRDAAGEAVDDATVRAGLPGDTVALTGSGGGLYMGSRTGWGRWFEVSAERGPDFLSGAAAPSPSLHAVSVAPDPPRRQSSAEARWSPNGESGVMAEVVVLLSGAGATHPAAVGRDDGMEALEPVTFPGLGDYQLTVTRASSETFDSPESSGRVQVIASKMMTVVE
jgi:hypothetical protein